MKRLSVFLLLMPMAIMAGCVVNSSKLAPGQKLQVAAGVMQGYQEYLHVKGSTGAFAVSLSGRRYAYDYCPGQRCLGGSSYGPQAIQMCESQGDTCVLFARDEGIIVPYEVVP